MEYIMYLESAKSDILSNVNELIQAFYCVIARQ